MWAYKVGLVGLANRVAKHSAANDTHTVWRVWLLGKLGL